MISRSVVSFVAVVLIAGCSGGSGDVCTWEQVYFHDLASTPPSATVRNGTAGEQMATAVYGRTAWYQTSDWNELVVPSPLTSLDDVFAIEADVYVPAFVTYGRHVSIFGFRNIDRTLGMGSTITSTGESSATHNWYIDPTPLATTAIPYVTGQWHTFRVEGRRSTCQFRSIVDGTEVGNYTGTCNTAGNQVYVTSNAAPGPSGAMNVAWSNLRVLTGTGGGCVP